MRVGAVVPTVGDLPDQPGLIELGHVAEAAGAESLWVNDHLVMPATCASRYPGSPDGRPTWPMTLPHYEALTCCSFLAAATSCRVGTGVLVLPQRNVLELAKVTATLDRLSRGRLVLGVGLGWLAEEMNALGYDFETRGRRADEMLDVLRRCWSGRLEGHTSDALDAPADVIVEPRPYRAGGPPVLVGGMSRPALRRAARRGDGWIAVADLAHGGVGELRAAVEAVKDAVADAGRDVDRFELVLKLHAPPALSDQLPGAAHEALALGFDELAVEPPWPDRARVARAFRDVRAAVT